MYKTKYIKLYNGVHFGLNNVLCLILIWAFIHNADGRLTARSREVSSRKIRVYTIPIYLKFDRHLGNSAAEMPVNFQWYDHNNPQSCGFQTSWDLVVRRLLLSEKSPGLRDIGEIDRWQNLKARTVCIYYGLYWQMLCVRTYIHMIYSCDVYVCVRVLHWCIPCCYVLYMFGLRPAFNLCI